METVTALGSLIAAYHPAILSLAVLSLAVLLQAFLTAPLAFVSNEQAPGMPLTGDHSLLSFRAVRTHMNSVESLSPFGFALLAAMLLSANPSLVNWVAIIHLGFRLLFWAVYYSGVGKVAGGLRTMSFVGGLLANLVLVGAAIYAGLS